MKINNLLKAANILFKHKLNCSGLKSLPKNCIPKNTTEAYCIQNLLKNNYLTLKENFSIGKKVGCTNKKAQEQINVNEPFYGNLFFKYSSISGCNLSSKNFFQPYLEPEIAFKIKNDININKAPFNNVDFYNLIDKILPCIEIVDFRFTKNLKKIGINNLIATNGASDYWIRSEKFYNAKKYDLNDHEVKVYINNKLIEIGNTKSVLNNPVNSALWIINKLALNGEPLLKDQYISTGTCTKAIPIYPGNIIKADFGTLGKVEINYI